MSFKTQAEIYQALLDGLKLRMTSWISNDYVYLQRGTLVSREGYKLTYGFSDFSNWELYEEPKKKKQVWQWRQYVGRSLRISEFLYTSDEVRNFSGKWEVHAGPFEVDCEE